MLKLLLVRLRNLGIENSGFQTQNSGVVNTEFRNNLNTKFQFGINPFKVVFQYKLVKPYKINIYFVSNENWN